MFGCLCENGLEETEIGGKGMNYWAGGGPQQMPNIGELCPQGSLPPPFSPFLEWECIHLHNIIDIHSCILWNILVFVFNGGIFHRIFPPLRITLLRI